MALAWFARGNGTSFSGLSYDLLALFAGLVVAGLNGTGANLIEGSPLATAQVYAVFSIQIGVSLYVTIVKPSADRIDNCMCSHAFASCLCLSRPAATVDTYARTLLCLSCPACLLVCDTGLTALQFLVEGSQTGVLILGGSYTTRGYTSSALSCQTAAFFLGLAALFLPLFEKVYNAVIHPISACCRGEFDPRNFFFAFVALLLAIPGAVSTILGIGNAEMDDAMGGAEEALGLAEEGVDVLEGVGDQLEDLAGGLAELGSNVAGDLHWMSQAKKAEKRGKNVKLSWKGVMLRLRRSKTKSAPEGKEELPAEGKEELGSQAELKDELPAEAAEETGTPVYEPVPRLAPGVTSALDKPYRSADSNYSVNYSVDAGAAQDYGISQHASSTRAHFSSLDAASSWQSLDKFIDTAPVLRDSGGLNDRRSQRRSRASTVYSVDPVYLPQYVYLGPGYSDLVYDSTHLGEASGSAAGRRNSSIKVVKVHRRISAEPSEPLGMELSSDDQGRVVTVSVTAGSRAAQAGIPVGAILVDVNGLSVRKMDLSEVSGLLADLSSSGTRHLTFSAVVGGRQSQSRAER